MVRLGNMRCRLQRWRWLLKEGGTSAYINKIVSAVVQEQMRPERCLRASTAGQRVLPSDQAGRPGLPPPEPRTRGLLSRGMVRRMREEARRCGPCDGTRLLLELSMSGAGTTSIRSLHSWLGGARHLRCSTYCWGSTPSFVTTYDTLSDRMRGFRMEMLPRTLRDAVAATREMGLRYLWVDSLCIVQGDDRRAKADWATEVLRMDGVYSNASLTISAAASSSSAGALSPQSCRLRSEARRACSGVVLPAAVPGAYGRSYSSSPSTAGPGRCRSISYRHVS